MLMRTALRSWSGSLSSNTTRFTRTRTSRWSGSPGLGTGESLWMISMICITFLSAERLIARPLYHQKFISSEFHPCLFPLKPSKCPTWNSPPALFLTLQVSNRLRLRFCDADMNADPASLSRTDRWRSVGVRQSIRRRRVTLQFSEKNKILMRGTHPRQILHCE